MSPLNAARRTTCMNCGRTGLHRVLDLGLQPNGNHFIAPEQIPAEPKFPLEMLVCDSCWQVQLAEGLPPTFMFDDHPYVSGANATSVEQFRQFAERAIAFAGLKRGDLMIDIGCNDGTLLSAFAANGISVFGIDPGKRVVELARAKGYVVARAYFNEETGAALRKLGIVPSLITATAVFYHVPDLHDFIRGLKCIMNEDAVFMIQGVNLKDLIEKKEFDHFYHEHTCIHSISALEQLFKAHEMRLLDVEFYPLHGGSFLAFVGRNESRFETSPRVRKAIDSEKSAGLMSLDRYQRFAAEVRQNMDALKNLLKKLKQEGRTVYGLGAPLKGSTLLNFCGIGPDLVSCLTEVNEFKIGLLSPGTHIPVVDERKLDRQPDYYLVLSWNMADYLIEKYAAYLKNGGRFIVPVPSLHIVEADGAKREVGI
jgi:SAM-dependent methyltransferase